MLYLLHLYFHVNFLQTDTYQEKEATWPRAPPFSVIVVGNSQGGASQIFTVAAVLAFLHVLLGHQLPWMCITRGAEHCFSQTCSWIMCSPWCFEGDVLRGSPATFCSWVWTWNESVAIHCRRQGRKSLLVLYFLMLFCSFAEFRVAILSN